MSAQTADIEARAIAQGKIDEDLPKNMEPVDIFSERPVPPFPVEVMPKHWQDYVDELGKATGFDPGAYLFLMLAHAGCLVDHRTRIKVNHSWNEPVFHWAAIVDASGGGKTPILNAAGRFAMEQYSCITKKSRRDYMEWKEACSGVPKDECPPQSPWKQRHADDVTVEALRDLLINNSEGITVSVDELTGWLGRMDAYSASAGKDRPAWIDAWSTRKDKPVNRSTKAPVIVPHWAVGVIGAIQPEMLAQQFKRATGSSDGLLQRFMLYQTRPATEPDLLAGANALTEASVSSDFKRLVGYGDMQLEIEDDGVLLLQSYIKSQRIVSSRTAAPRFKEHLSKFPAFVIRIAATLHCIHSDDGFVTPLVGERTVRDAIRIARVLYRHSEAIYSVLDDADESSRTLVISAAEAILAKEWRAFVWSDLTRNATGWRGADAKHATSAIDLLIELGWIQDVTSVDRARRGRRSDGRFAVNELVHSFFDEHERRIKRERSERYQAIQDMAAQRGR